MQNAKNYAMNFAKHENTRYNRARLANFGTVSFLSLLPFSGGRDIAG